MACPSIFAALALCAATATTAGPSGPVVVIDGDTFDIGGKRVRLHGVDAPESAQDCETGSGTDWACGSWVTEEVKLRYSGRAADCAEVDTDRYGRIVARCMVEGRDVGEALVADGLALAYVEFSRDYVDEERDAKLGKRGIWRGEVETPASWRRRAARPDPVEDAAPSGCNIKGNISGNGRIYHMPDDPFYGRTKIDTTRQERWFCSEDEARAAGWRRAKS